MSSWNDMKQIYVDWNQAGIDPSSRMEMLDAFGRLFGGGAINYQMVDFFRNCDRFSINVLPPNAMHAGYTFITRPRCCLTNSALEKRIEFLPLISGDPNSMQFALRCMLDTKFSKRASGTSRSDLVNQQNPFMTPVNNGLIGISGFPDPVLNTVTSEAGFHSEDQTIAIGYDQLQKTYDLSLSFRDPQNGPIVCLMYYWMLYIGYSAKGMMPAYAEDIERQRLNYTVSIYRFITDPSKRYIQHYAKATGCFPKSVPLGALFNYSETEKFIRSAGNFSIPFVANKIEYNDPRILSDFNHLVRRYYNRGVYDKSKQIDAQPNLSIAAVENYNGVPFVCFDNGKLELAFKGDPKQLTNRFLANQPSEGLNWSIEYK